MAVRTAEPKAEKSLSPIPSLTASEDVAKVRDTLQTTWDMYASDEFCAALIAYTDAMLVLTQEANARIAELETALARLQPSVEDLEALLYAE